MAKPMLVGEVNPYGCDSAYALFPLPEHASGGRLAAILGLSRTEYLRRFDRINLCEGRWSMRLARMEATDISMRGVPLVLLGAKVCAAFDLAFEPFAVRPYGGGSGNRGRVAILPHPSGRCRLWNVPRAYARAREAVAALLAARSEERSRG